MWLLTGDRPGELAQQRVLGAALGLPTREVQVAQLPLAGGPARFDLGALRPPWPRLAVSFGKTLPAALHLRAASGGATRLVHLGRARGVRASRPDLIIPMPQDVLDDAPTVLRIRMPFNFPPDSAAITPAETRLLASTLPRPWTALIVGGATRQLRFERGAVARIAREVCARANARGGSVLVSTSPRTPTAAIPALRAAIDAPGELYAYTRDDPHNPLAAYLRLADELVVTGDSASMVAECWRSGRPLWVAPARDSLLHHLGNGMRAILPRKCVEAGQVAAAVDINAWLRRLAGEGHVGLFGESDPTRRYAPTDDDDLRRAVERIRALLG